jgi:beta-galactosidase
LVVKLDSGWKFFRGDVDNGFALAFEDASWQTVAVPHTWNTEVDPPQRDYYRGPGWYRKQFDVPSNWKGRRVFVRFEAASLVARVYLNGREIGEHKGGFAAFCFELTPYLKYGGANVLAVRVDNTRREDVIPLGGDFTVFGGLYRPVSLIVTSVANITPLDYASPGVFLRESNVSPERADVEAIAEISNGNGMARAVAVTVTICDAAGLVVTTVRQKVQVAPRSTVPVTQKLVIPKPHFWNGVSDPYLYTARVELSETRKVIDAVEQPLGLRSFRVDPQQGFILNGKSRQLRGVDRHQDWAGLGWAIGEKEQDEDMALMRAMGADSVRLAHYQHNEYFYSLCDRNGLLVWAEVPMVNDVRGTEAFLDNVRQQLTELIRQNFNHPSIVFWSLFNEPSPKNVDPVAPIVQDLQQLAKKEDPSRLTTGALSIDGIEKLHDVGQIPDVLALNVYPGWYIETPAAMGSILDKWNAAYGSKGIIVSEYGAGASIRQHQQDFAGRSGRAPNSWHPEEWQAIVHEGNYAAIKARPFVYGTFIWNMFDFASAGRNEGDTPCINDKGLVTRNRKVRKDAYFFYQANWTTQPVVYITSRRDTERTEVRTSVKVYSNCGKASMKLNGKSYGERGANELHVIQWIDLSLAEGENKVEVDTPAECGGLHDAVSWTYHPKQQ